MKAEILRNTVQSFLEKEKSISQNELSRRAGIPTSTFSKFLSGKFSDIDQDQEVRLLSIIKPEMSDIDVIAGRIKQMVVKKYPYAIAKAAIIRLSENIQKA